MVLVIVTSFTIALVVLAYLFYKKFTRTYSYWKIRGVKGPTPQFPFGNFKRFLTKKVSFTTLIKEFYNEFPEENVIGIYQGLTPVLIVRDPNIMKRIFVKDFFYFQDRGFELNDEKLKRSNLFTMNGENWRVLRQNLTPIFTSSKLKQFVQILNSSTKSFMEYLDELIHEEVTHEARGLFRKYSGKSLLAVHFGYHVDAWSDEINTLIEKCDIISKRMGVFRFSLIMLRNFGITFLDKFTRIVPEDSLNYFANIVNKITSEREGKPKRKDDLMDLLLILKEKEKNASGNNNKVIEFTNDILTAQALVFALGTLEAVSTNMAFIFYKLALNPDVQNHCHEEIKSIMEKYNEELTYESLEECKYLSMTFDEALRTAPGGMTFRQCLKDYEIPELNLMIEKGTLIYIHFSSLQNDPKYYENPSKFDPMRFAPENKNKIANFTYLPFGEGPRHCIAKRYAKLHLMVGLAHFIYRYRFTPSEKTPQVLQLDPRYLGPVSVDGLWINIERRINA
ncbi:cytochrome P450 6B2-like [Pectinophora gossypiella]|uniref:cytochrome P450 6B2-like n=1 Tax=Pectinophora gossypiella TaxID=13191 RepID=UPI00214E65FB|nr:cytochrome P450 6B2-like [Pectinophora gossypiella]